jgi:hypothetical protein
MSATGTNTTGAIGGGAIREPSPATMTNIFKKALSDDKPIMFDYWVGSLEKTVAIGVRDYNGAKERILVRNEEEYTSPISNIFRSNNEFIIVTENSIYVVDSGIKVKSISA